MNRRVLAVGLVVTLPLLVLLLANIDRNPTAIASPLVNRMAPDVRLRTLQGGGSIQVSGLKGRPAVVNFWASWCLPCIQEHGALAAAARANPDVTFLGIVYEDTVKNAQEFLAQRGEAYTNYQDADGKAAIAFGIYGVPETYFIDAAGMIVHKHVGPLDPMTLRDNLVAARR